MATCVKRVPYANAHKYNRKKERRPKRSGWTWHLTKRDYAIMAITFGFNDGDEFRKFVEEQQNKCEVL